MLGCAIREIVYADADRARARSMTVSSGAPSTPTAERLPLSTKALFGSGSIAEGTKNFAFNIFLLFYYNNVLGLSGSLTGFAIFIALCVDAITDPLVGSISDSFHSRWGRRHPFMYVSALPMAVCFWLLFSPPDLSSTGLFAWLCCFAVGVRASMTLYSIPSNSMVPEMTTHYDERTSLVSWRFLMGWLGGVGVTLLGYLYFFAPTVAYATGQLNPDAYPRFGLACAAIIFAAILTCTMGTHRLIPTMRSPRSTTAFSLGRLMGELGDAFGNHSYRMIVFGLMFASVAGGFNDVVGLYVNTYYWGFTTAQLSLLVFPLAISIVIAFLGTRRLTERFEKRGAALGLATFAVFFGPLPIYLRLAGLMPENGDPLLLAMILVHAGIIVVPAVSIGIIASSMIADTVDESELATGQRREGVFSSAIAFSLKAASGLGTLAAGIALDVIAFPRGATIGEVSNDKVIQLGMAVGPGLMLFYILTLVFLSRYRMTRERHREILNALAERSREAPSAV